MPTPLIVGLSAERVYKEVTYPHAHLRAQLLYASTGTIQVFTGDQVWIIPPMCAIWIPARIEHSMVSLSQVTLNTVLIEENAAKNMGSQCFLIRVSKLLHELLIRFNALESQTLAQQSISPELLDALQLIIYDEIHRANSLPIHIPWPKDARLLKICQMLLQQPNQTKDLNTWADMIGTSPRTLMRMFQNETGLSFRAWIQQTHIAIALSKISNGDSVSSIAEALGYANSSAFSSMFKRHFGKTPQQFKSQSEL